EHQDEQPQARSDERPPGARGLVDSKEPPSHPGARLNGRRTVEELRQAGGSGAWPLPGESSPSSSPPASGGFSSPPAPAPTGSFFRAGRFFGFTSFIESGRSSPSETALSRSTSTVVPVSISPWRSTSSASGSST